jgi:hypothetical protein
MTVRRSLWVPETGFSPENGSVTLQPEDRLPEADRDIGNSQIVPLRCNGSQSFPPISSRYFPASFSDSFSVG